MTQGEQSNLRALPAAYLHHRNKTNILNEVSCLFPGYFTNGKAIYAFPLPKHTNNCTGLLVTKAVGSCRVLLAEVYTEQSMTNPLPPAPRPFLAPPGPHNTGWEMSQTQKSSACVCVDTCTWGEGLPMNYLPSNYQDFILVTLKASFMELQGGRIRPISRQKDRRDMWAFPKQVVEYSPTYHVWLILLMKLKYSNVVK